MALIATAGGTHLATSQAETASEQTASQEELTAHPAGTDFVPANLTPSLEDAESDKPVIYSNDCHRDQGSTDSRGCQNADNPERSEEHPPALQSRGHLECRRLLEK